MTSGTSYTELVEKGREEGGQYMEREESSFSIRRIQDLEGKAKGQFGGKARPVSPLRPPKAKSQPVTPDPEPPMDLPAPVTPEEAFPNGPPEEPAVGSTADEEPPIGSTMFAMFPLQE